MGIVIKNGIMIANTDKYNIYQVYTDDASEYYLSTPIQDSNKYKMVIDFPEEYYKSLLSGDIVNEIKGKCDKLYEKNNNYIYILSNVTTYDLKQALEENDNHAYAVLLKKLQKYTYNAYKVITANNQVDIDQVIDIVTETDEDKKFMDWLDVNLSGLFNGISLNTITNVNDSEDTGWTTLSGPGGESESIDKANTKQTVKVKTLVPLGNKHGYSNIIFMIMLLGISLALGFIFSIYFLNL